MNIVDLVKEQLTSQVLGSLGSLAGTNEAQTKAASAAAVPALLGGLAKLAGNAQGAGQLASALGGLDLGMLGNLAGVLGGANSSKVSNLGGGLLGTLFGNTATSAISALSAPLAARRYFCANTQAASCLASASLTWVLAGIGTSPKAPDPPLTIFAASLSTASFWPAYFSATSL